MPASVVIIGQEMHVEPCKSNAAQAVREKEANHRSLDAVKIENNLVFHGFRERRVRLSLKGNTPRLGKVKETMHSYGINLIIIRQRRVYGGRQIRIA